MENIKNNALLYIGTMLQHGLHLLQSIAETNSNLHFGSPFSTGMVDWGYTRLVLLEHLRELAFVSPSGTHSGFLIVECRASVSAPYSTSIT